MISVNFDLQNYSKRFKSFLPPHKQTPTPTLTHCQCYETSCIIFEKMNRILVRFEVTNLLNMRERLFFMFKIISFPLSFKNQDT